MSPAKIMAAAIAAALVCAAPAFAADGPPGFAITGVRVFDGDKVLPKATVVVQAGKVTAIGAAVKPPAGVKLIDGAGKTLLPGLIDAHTHTFGDARPNALRFGVTTELDMFTYPGGLRAQLQQRDGMGATKSADLFSAGVLATAPKGHGTEYGFPIPTLTTPAEAEAWVTARLAEGSDYIKLVYEPHMEGRRDIPSLDKVTLKALVDSAHAHGKLAVAHISTLEGARDAIEVGVDGLMHAFADKPGDAAFYRLAAQHRVFVVPTLGVISGITGSGEGAKLAADPRIAPFLTSAQAGELKTTVRGSPAYKLPVAQGEVAALRAAKVDILAGTDAGNPTTTHGASLHEEMALLVLAGLTPVEALRAATGTPARRFSLTGRGRIAVGNRGDLVLVEGDPTQDIEATRAIAAIWKNGYPVDRTPPQAPAGPAARPLAGLLGDFEAGLGGPETLAWVQTSDAIRGGTSEAKVSRITPGAGASQGALHAEGVVRPSQFPWAGVQLAFSPTFLQPRDLSGAKTLVFRVRGDATSGRAMVFDLPTLVPHERRFPVTREWQEVRIPLADFGANLQAVAAFVIATGAASGAFSFDLDDVRLE
jgi:imidazolonepropionase-like amidohydrolase